MKRIVVASCDAKFYPHARALIASVHQTSGDVVDEIAFFDLGLTAAQRVEIATVDRVRVVDYPAWLTTEVYADFLMPRMFAWKTWVMREAAKLGETILYMDCGCIVLNALGPVFERIERDEAFFVQDVHRNAERTHEACFSIMHATAAERDARQIDAGVMGYRSDGRFAQIFAEGFAYAKNRACIFGDGVHRHDQSIYSILAARHGVMVMHPYGREVHWQGIQTRDQIIWQHRGKWPAFRRLQERAKKMEGGRRIAVYGAGKHTERYLATLQNLLGPRHRIVGVLDDAPRAPVIDGLPIVTTGDWKTLAPDVVVVSSDAHEAAMMEKALVALTGVDVWGIYGEQVSGS